MYLKIKDSFYILCQAAKKKITKFKKIKTTRHIKILKNFTNFILLIQNDSKSKKKKQKILLQLNFLDFQFTSHTFTLQVNFKHLL